MSRQLGEPVAVLVGMSTGRKELLIPGADYFANDNNGTLIVKSGDTFLAIVARGEWVYAKFVFVPDDGEPEGSNS